MMKRDFYKQSLQAIKAAKALIETRSELYGGYRYSSRPSSLLIYDPIDLKEKSVCVGRGGGGGLERGRWAANDREVT